MSGPCRSRDADAIVLHGAMLPGARKSVEPMAARLRPDRTSGMPEDVVFRTKPGAGQARPRAPNRRYARLRSSPGMPDHIASRGRKKMTAGWRCGPERFGVRGICTKG